MKKIILLFAYLFFSVGNVIATESVNDIWLKANAFYQQKNFEEAIIWYEKLAISKPENTPLYFNLGNAYYKANHIGQAVLNYKRALHCDPNFKAAKENLELTFNRIPNRIQTLPDIFFVQWWKSITRASLTNFWTILSLVFFLIFIGLLTTKKIKLNFNYPNYLNVLMFTFICICLLFSFVSTHRKFQIREAVVMVHDAPFQQQLANGSNKSLIPEGTVIQLQSINGQKAKVILPDGREGEIELSFLTII